MDLDVTNDPAVILSSTRAAGAPWIVLAVGLGMAALLGLGLSSALAGGWIDFSTFGWILALAWWGTFASCHLWIDSFLVAARRGRAFPTQAAATRTSVTGALIALPASGMLALIVCSLLMYLGTSSSHGTIASVMVAVLGMTTAAIGGGVRSHRLRRALRLPRFAETHDATADARSDDAEDVAPPPLAGAREASLWFFAIGMAQLLGPLLLLISVPAARGFAGRLLAPPGLILAAGLAARAFGSKARVTALVLVAAGAIFTLVPTALGDAKPGQILVAFAGSSVEVAALAALLWEPRRPAARIVVRLTLVLLVALALLGLTEALLASRG